MSSSINIEKIEVDVYTLSSGDNPQPIPWETAPNQIARPDQWGNFNIKVPIDGAYSLTLRVVGHCSDCCQICYTGKPIYKGNSGLIQGTIIPSIKVHFVDCECCD